ncbi:retrotransposon protein, putative, ty1-copia subclass [Tanacetum coccineum]
MYVIKQPISLAPPVDSKYLRSEIRFMMLIMRLVVLRSEELKFMFKKQAGVERFDLIQTFHSYKQEDGKPVGPYVIKMKNYVAQLERLGYVLPRDLSVGLIMNGLTSDFAGFVRNYNKHNMGKKIESRKPIRNRKMQKAKDDTCHHYKEVGHYKRNCHAYLAELIKKKQVDTASSSDIFVIELFSFPTKSWMYDTSYGTHIYNTKHGLRGVRKLKQVEAIGSFDLVLPNDLIMEFQFLRNNILYLMLLRVTIRQSEKRNHTLLDMVQSMTNLTTLLLSFWDYAIETATHILNMVPTKKVDKTPYELWYGEVPNLSYLKVWGYEALVKRDTPDKLQQRSVKCIFIGYPKETMSYYFYFLPKNKIVFVR